MLRLVKLLSLATTASATITPARRVCRPGPPAAALGDGTKGSVLIIGDSISIGAMNDLTAALQSAATVVHAPFSGDGGALDCKCLHRSTNRLSSTDSDQSSTIGVLCHF